MDLARLEAAGERIRKAGNIHQHLDLIAGLPYEDYRSFAHSFDEIYALKPNQILCLPQRSPDSNTFLHKEDKRNFRTS